MKRWIADHIWIVFWIACLSQVTLWVWWINHAAKHTPQRIEPAPPRPAVIIPAEADETGNRQQEGPP